MLVQRVLTACTSAFNDTAVERESPINSADPVSHAKKRCKTLESTDDQSDSEGYVKQAFRDLAAHHKTTHELKRAKLELATWREEREEEERAERREIRRRQDKHEAQAAREVQWKRALEMSASSVEHVKQKGIELMNRLEAEELAERDAEQA